MQESLLDFPGGFILIKGELTELGWKFFNLMHHNQQVFSPYYAKILKNKNKNKTQQQQKNNISSLQLRHKKQKWGLIVMDPRYGNREPGERAHHVPGMTSPVVNRAASPLPHYNQDTEMQGQASNTKWSNLS